MPNEKKTHSTQRTSALSAVLGAAAVLGIAYSLNGILRADARNDTPQRTEMKAANKTKADPKIQKVVKTEAEWRKILTPTEFHILREAGTEAAFSGDYKAHGAGIYKCAGCGLSLFNASTKFDSGTGWPSFWQPIAGHVIEKTDSTFGMERTEITCARCDGHLGHVFNDGPKPTGLRYCMNSPALKFVPAAEKK